MNQKYIEKFSEDIIINVDNLKKQCEFFINNIEKNAEEYAKNIKKEKDEFNKLYKNNKKVIFTPENLLNASPMTILDAPWGTGKTFFIESLCKFILKDEINLNYIDKIIVVDSWKYSVSNSIPTDFIFYLVENLAQTFKLKDDVKYMFINFLNSSFVSIFNKFAGTSFEFKNKKIEDLDMDKVINKLNNYIEKPTLIVVDNIERIGENGWEILKTIQKLAMLNNLIFILPMNKDKLVSEKLKNSEWKIEKYINIPFYSFKQDYIGLLNKYNIRDDLINIFNDLLSMQIDGECMSIRELDKILYKEKEKINKNFRNKYNGLIFFNEIWPQEIEIKRIILNDLNSFLNIMNEVVDCIDSFNNLFNTPEYSNIAKCFSKYTGLNIENQNAIEYVDCFNNLKLGTKDLNSYWKNTNVVENIDFKQLKCDELKIKKNNVSKAKVCKNNIDKIEKKIENLDIFINDYNMNKIEKSSDNNKKYSRYLEELAIQKNALPDWKNKYNTFINGKEIAESNINEIRQLKINLNNFKEKAQELIDNICKKFYENIDENMSFIFKILFNNNYLLTNAQNENIEEIYNYFINEIKNQQ